jgi:hypothetical protein
MQTFVQYKTAQLYAPKQLKTKGEPSIEAPHRESQAHLSLPSAQIGFERKFPGSKSRPPRSKGIPISSSRLAALNFFNTLGFVSHFPLTPVSSLRTPTMSLWQKPLILSGKNKQLLYFQ